MTRVRALLIAFLVLSLAAIFPLAEGAKKPSAGESLPQQKTVIFTVFGSPSEGLSATMEPILILEGGQLKEPVSGSSDANDITRFSNEYYRKGQRYRLLFGGAEAGTAIITKSSANQECFRTGADISMQTNVKLNRNVMALATDSNSLGLAAGERSRRTPTPAERAQALELARAAYKQKGVAASLLPGAQVVNLTAVDLDRDGQWELAGSFVASKRTRKQQRYVLFLLAVPSGSGYKTAFSNYESFGEEAVMSGANIDTINDGTYVERLVEHLDLDNDKVNELITTTTGLEGVTYYVYKRQNGAWNKVYEFGNYRCAF
jgi:hypothetical protein